MAAELTKELYASDGLALPIPSAPTVSDLAKGRDRTLVLGAGGEYYLGWYCGFFHGLYDHGLDMNAMSEMVVGTSAGSYMGSSLTSGHFLRLRSEFKFFGHFPSLFAKLTPLSSSNPSQQRAMKLNAAAKDGEISTLQTIGRAALDRHRSREFIEFLKLLDAAYPASTAIKLILDNHSAHISRETRAWLDTRPAGRFDFTFTPKHGSWLNLIEGFFSKFARSVLRHIRVTSKHELKQRIMAGIDDVNRHPVLHTWSYKLAEAA